MEELIKITETNGKQAVSARELYKFLGATERFSVWFERQMQYGFVENVDYIGCKEFNTLANQELTDYALTLDCAKEISMLQRSDKGKQARLYFIECEKQLRTSGGQLPATYAAALRALAEEVESKEEIAKQLEAKTEALDESKSWYTIKRRAMIKGISWRLYNWRDLKRLSVLADKPIKKVFDANYGEVNLYHLSIFETYEKTLNLN